MKKANLYQLTYYPDGSGAALEKMAQIFRKRGYYFSYSNGTIQVWGHKIEIELTIKNANLPLR